MSFNKCLNLTFHSSLTKLVDIETFHQQNGMSEIKVKLETVIAFSTISLFIKSEIVPSKYRRGLARYHPKTFSSYTQSTFIFFFSLLYPLICNKAPASHLRKLILKFFRVKHFTFVTFVHWFSL